MIYVLDSNIALRRGESTLNTTTIGPEGAAHISPGHRPEGWEPPTNQP
jgi:hypothetical protein